jgi:hypothetical protein
MSKLVCSLTAALMMLTAGSAMADSMVWDTPNGASWGGYYTGPYYAWDTTRNPVKTLGTALSIYCIDFNNDIAPPFAWEANINRLTSANLSSFQYGGVTGAGMKYEEAAWLFTQAQALYMTNWSSYVPYQVAAWTLFASGSRETQLKNSIMADHAVKAAIYGTDGLLARAAAAVTGGWDPTTANWYVITGDPARNGGRVQEFLVQGGTPDQFTPEPAAILLFGTILLGTARLLGRRHV